jgi:hypothetical protein
MISKTGIFLFAAGLFVSFLFNSGFKPPIAKSASSCHASKHFNLSPSPVKNNSSRPGSSSCCRLLNVMDVGYFFIVSSLPVTHPVMNFHKASEFVNNLFRPPELALSFL